MPILPHATRRPALVSPSASWLRPPLMPLLLPVLLPALLLCQACTRPPDTKAPNELPAQKLEPIPDPPPIQVEHEALPGADGRLAVVVARPTGEVTSDLRPTITFSKPIMALETVEKQKQTPPPASITPAIPGEWRWIGSSSVEFVPSGLVPYATHFKVSVPAGLTALDGTKLEQPYAYEFDSPHPALQSVSPSTSSERPFRWAKPDQVFTLEFNQPVVDLEKYVRIEPGVPMAPIAIKVLKAVDVAQELRDSEEGRRYPRASFEEKGFKNRQTRYEVQGVRPIPRDHAFQLVVKGELKGKEGTITLGEAQKYAFKTYGAMAISTAQACLYHAGSYECGEEVCACSYGPLVLVTTNQADATTLKGRLKIDPAVDIDWENVAAAADSYDSNMTYIAVPGKFRPGTTYKIEVAAGVKDEFGQLAQAFKGSMTTADIKPYLQTGNDIALLEASGDGSLPLESANISTVVAKVWNLTPAAMAQVLAAEGTQALPPATAPTELKIDVSATRNRVRWTPLELRKALPKGTKTGLFLTMVGSPDLPLPPPKPGAPVPAPGYRQSRILAQITDIAVHAKLGAKSGVAWVTGLNSGAPVAGAAVTLYDSAGRKKWEGSSSADGTVMLPGLATLIPSQYDWQTPFALLAAQKGTDIGVTLSTWDAGLWPGTFNISSDGLTGTSTSLGTIITDRGIYRPGDEVHFKGLLRYRKLGDILAPPTGTPVLVTVTDSKDTQIFTQTLTVSKFGTFDAKFNLGKDIPLGGCSVAATLKIGAEDLNIGGFFQVQEYRAPQFQVDVTTVEPQIVAGTPIKANVIARYLFGGAMSGARVRWSVARTSSEFAPPGNDAFTFGANTWWWDDDHPESSRDVFASGEGLVDAQGAFILDPGRAEAPGDKPWEYTLEAEVEDVSRQRVANRTLMIVHPAEVYAGVRVAGEGFATAGKVSKLELIATTPKGRRVAGQDISVEVKRRDWKNIRQKGVGDRWYTVSEPEETKVFGCEVKSLETAASCDFTPAQAGLHIVEVTVKDSQGRKQVTRTALYAVGDGWVSWQRNDTDRIDLVADKQLYDVGETAKVLVKSPYPEANALVTVEREGVISERMIQLKGAATTLDVPVSEADVPNVFVSVVIVRGRVPNAKGVETGDDPGRPAVKVGYVELKVEKKSKRLNVVVTPDAEGKRPRDHVKLDLKVTDWQGKGAKAELAVWAVDEGVLRLTGYQLPDLVEAIHPERGLAVRIAEPLMHLVLRRMYGEKGLTPGGSGGLDSSGAGIRSNFKTTAVFEPSVLTDDNGVAHLDFVLPDNLTTFRIMAVAITETDRFGGGQSKVVVSKPLLVLPALPRLARVGDKLEAGVVVHLNGATNKGAPLKSVKVQAQATGIKLVGSPTRTVSVADGRPHEVRFNYIAETEGTATFRFTVAGGGESDGVEQKIPVLMPVVMEAVATYGDTTDKKVEAIVPPGGVMPDKGGLDLTLSSTVLGGFDEGMRQLIDYPYGCLEQLSSRLVPFVALRELYAKFGQEMPVPGASEQAKLRQREDFILSWIGKDVLGIYGSFDPDEVAQRTVKAIERLQNPDGGYRYWQSSGCSSEWASSYAVLALARAKEIGYPVDADGLKNGQKFLADTVAAGKAVRCMWGSSTPDDTTRVFALYALARSRAPKSSYYGEIFKRRDKLPLFARAMLADAMYVGGGDRAQARTVLTEVMNFAKETPSTVHFEEANAKTYATMWSSDTRTTAIVLQTLTTISPDHPFVGKIGRYLTSVRKTNGRFRNTQEAAFSLMALVDVVRTKEQEVPDFVARVQLGADPLVVAEFKGRSMKVEHKQASMAEVTKPLGGVPAASQPLTFVKEGKGVLYYGALLRYAPAQMPTTALDRGIVVQRWFEPYNGGGQARQFNAGDLVRVRVRVGTPQERLYVAIDVPLPAGLEPVDTSLASTAQLPQSQNDMEGQGEGYENESSEDQYGDGGEVGGDFSAWSQSFYSPFNHVEQRDDRVVLFSDDLPPGVHTTSFVARATTPGDFVLKPAHAEEMYTPEVFGRSDGGRFQVLDTRSMAEK